MKRCVPICERARHLELAQVALALGLEGFDLWNRFFRPLFDEHAFSLLSRAWDDAFKRQFDALMKLVEGVLAFVLTKFSKPQGKMKRRTLN